MRRRDEPSCREAAVRVGRSGRRLRRPGAGRDPRGAIQLPRVRRECLATSAGRLTRASAADGRSSCTRRRGTPPLPRMRRVTRWSLVPSPPARTNAQRRPERVLIRAIRCRDVYGRFTPRASCAHRSHLRVGRCDEGRPAMVRVPRSKARLPLRARGITVELAEWRRPTVR